MKLLCMVPPGEPSDPELPAIDPHNPMLETPAPELVVAPGCAQEPVALEHPLPPCSGL